MEDPIYDAIPHTSGIPSQPTFQEAAEEYTDSFFSQEEFENSFLPSEEAEEFFRMSEEELTSASLTEEEQTLLGTPSEYLPEELQPRRAALVARLTEEDPTFVDPF